MHNTKTFCGFALTVLFLLPLAAVASVTEKQVIEKLDFIRSIKVTSDEEKLKHYNTEMDKAWSFFKDNREQTLPILKKQLELEAQKAQPNHFLLLDVGFFLMLSQEQEYQQAAQKVLFKIDPYDEVVTANFQQLFHFTYQVSQAGNPAVLDYLDRAFLSRDDATVFVPQHAMSLKRELINVFLYGVYGPDAELHLQKLLQDNYKKNPQLARNIVELLIWIGTEKSIPQVKQLMETHGDYATFARCLAYFMKVGGKKGQQIVLNVDTAKLDDKAKKTYQSISDKLKEQSFEKYQTLMSGVPGDSKLENDVVKSRLEAMYKNYGKDDQTSPLAVLNADLPKEYLLEQLVKIRSRMLFRLSDEALDDVNITNVLLNALRYRDK